MSSILNRRIVFVMFMSLACLYAKADDGLITRQMTINVSEAGMLNRKISDADKYRITDLKLTGELNVSDMKFVREMADCYTGRETSTGGHLEHLDISEVKFVGNGQFDVLDSHENVFKAKFCENEIGRISFAYLRKLKSINIPGRVTGIGGYAFYGCGNLTSVDIPNGVTSIGEHAFFVCTRLTSVDIPNSVTSIGGFAFFGCSSLASIGIPGSVASIEERTFFGCTSLTSVDIPNGVTSIGECAFSDCSSLASVGIPNSVTSIGYGAFLGCSSLASVVIPGSVTSIGQSAFGGCSSLASVNIPSGVTDIGPYTFSRCSSLASIDIPGSVTFIGISAFAGCSSLTSVSIPSSVAYIGTSVFYNCSSLVSIYSYRATPPKVVVGESLTLADYSTCKRCVLYVPIGSRQTYRYVGWGDFKNIVEFDPTGIEQTKESSDVMETSRCTIDGKRLNAPANGVNIVKYSDGTVRKVWTK